MNIYKIDNDKFKTINLSLNYTMNLKKENYALFSVLSALMAKSCVKYKTQKEIEKYLNSLYGASFDVNVEKYGDLFNIEFLIEGINKSFLPNNTDIINKTLEFLYEVIYNQNFNENINSELVKREKSYILEKIRTKKDDKLRYGISKMEEIMCKNENFGMYLYGDEENLNKVNEEALIEAYNYLLNESCISVILSGNLKGYTNIENEIKNIFGDKLESKLNYTELVYNQAKENNEINKEVKENFETGDTTQSVISLGLKINNVKNDDFYALNVYNAILGATPSSKLFQNFREKESLAYTVRSKYYRFKNLVIIYAGIENKNYEKAKEVLFKQIQDIKNGKVSEDEFFAAKESLLADLKEWDDYKQALSKMLLVNILIYNNSNINIDKMLEKIKNVTLEDVINVANKMDIKNLFFLGGAINE